MTDSLESWKREQQRKAMERAAQYRDDLHRARKRMRETPAHVQLAQARDDDAPVRIDPPISVMDV